MATFWNQNAPHERTYKKVAHQRGTNILNAGSLTRCLLQVPRTEPLKTRLKRGGAGYSDSLPQVNRRGLKSAHSCPVRAGFGSRKKYSRTVGQATEAMKIRGGALKVHCQIGMGKRLTRCSDRDSEVIIGKIIAYICRGPTASWRGGPIRSNRRTYQGLGASEKKISYQP